MITTITPRELLIRLPKARFTILALLSVMVPFIAQAQTAPLPGTGELGADFDQSGRNRLSLSRQLYELPGLQSGRQARLHGCRSDRSH